LLNWLEPFYPLSDDEFVYVVEDDTVVSPFYYSFLLDAVHRVRALPLAQRADLYGISLQRQYLVPGLLPNGRPAAAKPPRPTHHVYEYSLVGTWGQLLFPDKWREFRLWFEARYAGGASSESSRPYLGNMITDQWYRGKGDTIWTPWFIKFVHARRYTQLYTYFAQDWSLATSYRDAGQNTNKDLGPDARLVRSEDDLAKALAGVPRSDDDPFGLAGALEGGLDRVDYCGHQVHRAGGHGRPPPVGSETLEELLARVASADREVAIATVTGGMLDLFHNWRCSLEKVHVTNYLVYLPGQAGSELHLDLHRRGVPVYADEALDSTVTNRSLAFYTVDYQQLMLRRTRLIAKSLELSYNVLIADVDAVWLANPWPHLRTAARSFDVSYQHDGGGSATNACGGFVYLTATDGAKELWAAVLTGHEKLLDDVAAGRRKLGEMNEQIILNDLLRGASFSHLRHGKLPEDKFPHGAAYFSQGKRQHAVVVHNNWIIGHANKVARFRGKPLPDPSIQPKGSTTYRTPVPASLWLIDDDDLACRSVSC